MVRGETYYVKHQTTPSISLTGYTGEWEVIDINGTAVKSGAMTNGGDYFVTQIATDDLTNGRYRIVGLVTFPDLFVQAILNTHIDII